MAPKRSKIAAFLQHVLQPNPVKCGALRFQLISSLAAVAQSCLPNCQLTAPCSAAARRRPEIGSDLGGSDLCGLTSWETVDLSMGPARTHTSYFLFFLGGGRGVNSNQVIEG